MDQKRFTPREANRTLPHLVRILKSLKESFEKLRESGPGVVYAIEEYRVVNEGPVRPDYFLCLMKVRGALKEVDKLGVQVKDVKAGLVDFPARLGGREVLLCWKLGEDRVEFYHDPEAGFAGRQRLPSAEAGDDVEEEGT